MLGPANGTGSTVLTQTQTQCNYLIHMLHTVERPNASSNANTAGNFILLHHNTNSLFQTHNTVDRPAVNLNANTEWNLLLIQYNSLIRMHNTVDRPNPNSEMRLESWC